MRWPPFGRLALGFGSALVLLWLLDVSGTWSGLVLARGAALLTVLAAGGAAIRLLAVRPELRWPAAFLALSLLVRFVGIDHEVHGRYYADEGTYYKQASLINQGRLFSPSFNYPHLLYWAGAFALWLSELLPGLAAGLADHLYGVREPLARSWLTLRAVVALSSALTVPPVWFLARRLAGPLAAAVAALLTIASPLLNQQSHLIICDVPSAFFATWCLALVGRLAEREGWRDYLLAGVASGLAAASKYPAGVVAVAIVAVWLFHRLRSRDWRWGLFGAGAASLGAFLLVMPAIFVYPQAAFAGKRGIFFGVRQYAGGGWLGVQPTSHAAWYGEELVTTFGLVALGAGLIGLLLQRREVLRRLAWNLPYPVLFLAMMVGMTMVVKRNLLPVLPALAVILGVGLAGWWRSRPTGGSFGWRNGLALVVLLLALAGPLHATWQQSHGLAAPSNREVALEWIRQHVPAGARFVKESYTPRLSQGQYPHLKARFAGRFSLAEIRHPSNDYLLLASAAYRRFLKPEELTKEHHRVFAERYRRIFDEMEPLVEFPPNPTRLGPLLRLYALDPLVPDLRRQRRYTAEEAFCSAGVESREAGLAFVGEGAWCVFKGYFAAGPHRLQAAATATADIAVRAREGTAIGSVVSAEEIALPTDGKYFFYVRIPAGERLTAFEVAAPAAESQPESSSHGSTP
ncbi:MAG: glycosyltransferase family 39 protein [Acidobacteriota bacterium]